MTTGTEEKRWLSSIRPLFDTLAAEAREQPTSVAARALDGGWAWRILPDSVVVGVRTVGAAEQRGLYRMELRLATDPTATEWESRCAEVLRELGIRISKGERASPFLGALWYPLPLQGRDDGKLAARFVMLAAGEKEPPAHLIGRTS